MGTMPLQPTSKRSPAPSPQFRPHPHPPPTNMFRCNGFISTSPFTPSPPQHLPSFCFHFTFHTTTAHKHTTNQQLAATLSTNFTLASKPWNSTMECWWSFPSRHAELIAFLSNTQYNLILFQETHLSATKKFQIPGYSTLRTDRTFAR